MISIVVALVYIPINRVQGPFFPTPSPAFVIVCFLDDWGEVGSQCSFDLWKCLFSYSFKLALSFLQA
jgi:hypothetical protein